MAEGRSNQAISERLFVTPRAVEKHVTSIFQKLRLPASAEDHRRVLAVLTYLRGWKPAPPDTGRPWSGHGAVAILLRTTTRGEFE